jgi:hypothetical protein
MLELAAGTCRREDLVAWLREHTARVRKDPAV